MEHLSVPQGEFDLARYPIRKKELLRAWDAADELLLEHLSGFDDDGPVDLSGNVVVVNDSFGALTTALAPSGPTSFGDSFTSHLSARENLEHNRIDSSKVVQVGSLDPLPERIDVVVMKLPKSLALAQFQLARLGSHVHAETIVIAGAMTKHVHRSGLAAFESTFGTTTTSLARRKARLIFSRCDQVGPDMSALDPATFMLEPGKLRIRSHAGVFSPRYLDPGTSILLDNLPDQAGRIRIVDLGCGNGVVGLVALVDNPDADVIFVDDSYLAVASAEATVQANLGASTGARFVVGNGLEALSDGVIEAGSVDLIFNNPPFHSDHTLSDAIAWQMFNESRRALCRGGQLWVVGNRHLAYHAKLKRIFGNCDVIDSNSKFVVFRSTK